LPSGDVIERVRDAAGRVAGGYGLEIFDVQFRREASGMVLRVRLDRPGPGASAEESVSVDDCANVSRDLSAILDVDDVVPGAYTLEVSSPGMDEPLKVLPQYLKRIGKKVSVLTFDGMKREGTLLAANAEGIEMEENKEMKINGKKETQTTMHKLSFSAIKEIRPVFSFDKLLK
jgi:ribosome maturation factor RimP